ncbi:hypothetical protein HY388_00200 [Candidatus Daviesbacteria bacterium]|nr:hypothetical protein [Candidatus Daviesbacteria bacterium]MBI4039235.1 hypothetical protein [Candidatus Daviesbacteria bacterium]
MGKETSKQKPRKDIIIIDLAGQFPPEDDLQFLRAELPKGRYRYFLALVRYAHSGVESPMGVRIDLDKRVFLDDFNSPEIEKIAQKSAPALSSYIASKVNKKNL